MDDARLTPPEPPPAFREVLWPAPLGWALVGTVALMAWLALAVLDPRIAIGGAVAVLVVGVVLLVRTSPRVEVAGGELRAGQAHIPVQLLAQPQALDAQRTRTELGPRLDARAHVCLRGWIPTAVRVEVVDPEDPTPYWLVSTRRPDDLVRALAS
ncbi:DUF3093 domain-containing protein [Cellulomonas alba]|uniref:DUF3093 domain-containing protein n=1 Tax=Cellulomonas alba TaxID=3053467 RepID=A0ABT7SBK7_9CELL|nr:DUF3093 domain-containing protein [Cellulomonas alba]MDM7853569.1 DUF3093 domain-containing protein [Cellulomonas alba]